MPQTDATTTAARRSGRRANTAHRAGPSPRWGGRTPPGPARAAVVGLLAGLLAALVLTACAEPELPEGDVTDADPGPTEPAAPDPSRDQLLAALDELTAAATAASEALLAAQQAPDAAAARRAGAQAVAELVADPTLTAGARPTGRALLPGRSADRGATTASDDALTTLATAARNGPEPLASQVTDLLRDPIAGDLGAWSRDPAGMVRLAQTAAATGAELPETEQAVLGLPGEATRALAWSLRVADSDDPEEAASYAERGLAHLDLILGAADAVRTERAP